MGGPRSRSLGVIDEERAVSLALRVGVRQAAKDLGCSAGAIRAAIRAQGYPAKWADVQAGR